MKVPVLAAAFAFAVLLANPRAAQGAEPLTVSRDGPVPIVIADDATAAEKTAAVELRDSIRRMTGADCPVIAERSAREPAIFVGPTAKARAVIADYDRLDREEWVIRTADGSLVLGGGRPRGVLYAAYEFLEHMGVLWPDEVTECMPVREKLEIPAFDIRSKPVIGVRSIYTGHNAPTRKVERFYARNKMNAQVTLGAEFGGSELLGRPGGCHTFHAYSRKEWPDAWFSLDAKGARVRSTSGSGPGQLCLTNPDVRKMMAARLREFILLDRANKDPDAWPHVYDISHNDNESMCVCTNCRAFAEREGSFAGPLVDFINSIANDIAADYPDIRIQTFAYTWTLDAPKTVRPDSNVIMRVCKLGREFTMAEADTLFPVSHPRNASYLANYRKWNAISSGLAVWDYWIVYSKPYQPPYLNARSLREDITFYRDNGLQSIFVENEKMGETSFSRFKVWFGLKMMQDPSQSYDELADRFCRAYYGGAAAPLREYMDYLQLRLSQADVSLGETALVDMSRLSMGKGVSAEGLRDVAPYVDRAFFEKANGLLDRAEELAEGDPAASAHIRQERLVVDRTLLAAFLKFESDPPLGVRIPKSREALFDRYARAAHEQAEFYGGEKSAYGLRKPLLDGFESDLKALRGNVFAKKGKIPDEFAGRMVVDIDSTLFAKNLCEDDADACGGRALAVRGSERPDFHRLPFEAGVYDRKGKVFRTKRRWEAQDIAQDGKYHLFRIGSSVIRSDTIFWLHWSWCTQAKIDVATMLGDVEWEVFASLKFTGEPYVKGSKEKAEVRCDRIFLVAKTEN